jgi:hypothetical protein
VRASSAPLALEDTVAPAQIKVVKMPGLQLSLFIMLICVLNFFCRSCSPKRRSRFV